MFAGIRILTETTVGFSSGLVTEQYAMSAKNDDSLCMLGFLTPNDGEEEHILQ